MSQNIKKIGISSLYCLIIGMIGMLLGNAFSTGLLIAGFAHLVIGALSKSNSITGVSAPPMADNNASKTHSVGLQNISNSAPEISRSERDIRNRSGSPIFNRNILFDLIIRRRPSQLIIVGILSILIGMFPYLKYFMN